MKHSFVLFLCSGYENDKRSRLHVFCFAVAVVLSSLFSPIIACHLLHKLFYKKPQCLRVLYLLLQDAVALVQDIPNAEEASRRLITEAYARGSSDNITSIVVRFDKS